jgi:hypothetical protein
MLSNHENVTTELTNSWIVQFWKAVIFAVCSSPRLGQIGQEAPERILRSCCNIDSQALSKSSLPDYKLFRLIRVSRVADQTGNSNTIRSENQTRLENYGRDGDYTA